MQGAHRRVRIGTAAAFDNNVLALVPKRVDSRYLCYWLSQMAITPVAQPGAVASLDMAAFRGLQIPDLERAQQAGIASFLDRECARIKALDQELGDASSAAVAAYVELLRGLVLEGGHPFAPLKFYAKTGTGHTPSREHPEYWAPEECVVPWFTLTDVHQIRDGRVMEVTTTSERVSEAGLANSSAVKHPAGTVLLSRTASVGFSALMGVDMAVSQDFMTWTCGPQLDPHYLVVALRAMQPELHRLMYGSTHKTIYMPDLHALRVPLPPLTRQREIVADARQASDTTWPLLTEIEQLRASLSEYRDALITEAVTGQLDITGVSEARMDEALDAVRHGEQPEVLAS